MPVESLERKKLELAIVEAGIALETAKAALIAYDSSADNNVFTSHEEAQDELTDSMREEAGDDCEGAYNCGCEYYEREYKLEGDDTVYIARLDVEYNRHDKTYYYVDGTAYSYRVK